MHSTTSHALPSSALMCGSGHIQSWCSSQIDSLFVCECKVTILLVGLENPHKNPRFEWHSTLHIYWIHFHVDYCVLCRTIIQHSNSWKRFAEFNHFWEKNAGRNFRISLKRHKTHETFDYGQAIAVFRWEHHGITVLHHLSGAKIQFMLFSVVLLIISCWVVGNTQKAIVTFQHHHMKQWIWSNQQEQASPVLKHFCSVDPLNYFSF